MGWDAAFVGELQVDAKRFSELRRGTCPGVPVAGLTELTKEPTEPRSFDAVVAALEAFGREQPERLLQIEAKPRKGTVTVLGVLDEDSFRALLPGITQIFAHGASLGGEGALTMFGLESDDDLAHQLAIEGGQATVRALTGKARRPLDGLRAKIMRKLAMRMPPLVTAVAEGTPIALHPKWARRPMFPELEVSYRSQPKKQSLRVEVRTERVHDGDLVAIAFNELADAAAAGVLGGERFAPKAGAGKPVEQPSGRNRRSRGVVSVVGVEPIGLKFFVEALASKLHESGLVGLRIASDAAGEPEVDTAQLRAWLADPWACPRGPSAVDFVVEDLPPPEKGARVEIDTDASPQSEPLLMATYAVTSVLSTTPDPHGASRKAIVEPIFAFPALPRIKKAKRGGVEVSFTDWTADRSIARGLFLGALQRLHAKHPVRRVAFALPG